MAWFLAFSQIIVLLCVCAKAQQGPILIWPIPQQITATGSPVTISPALGFYTDSKSSILKGGILRYQSIIHGLLQTDENRSDGMLTKIQISVSSDDETLDAGTSYRYNLGYSGGDTLLISADLPFGAIYGLESLSQIISKGNILYSNINITDWSQYNHRGLMLDTGRRFCPMELIYSTLDAMSYVKLNVFHWHFADFCRFSVESKLYPELRNGESQIYTQEDVRKVVEYAKERGIRVVPEVEIAMHVHGMQGLSGKGLNFCSSEMEQLYNDPKGETAKTLKILLNEMSTLFPDKLFHLGCDETKEVGDCTLENTKSLETGTFEYMKSIGKIPFVWEEALTVTDSVINGTVIQAWKNAHMKDIVDKGFMAVDSDSSHFYLDTATRPPAAFWTDIAPGMTPDEKKLVLGGEVAMWTDYYCFIQQCVTPSKKPIAWWMYDEKYDAEFTLSINGLIWPRTVIGAGSFWNYQSSIDPSGTQFKALYTATNQRLQDRNILTCPNDCTCDFLNRCGQPIVQGIYV